MRRGRIFFYLAFILLLGLLAVVVVWQRFLRPAGIGGDQAPAPTAVTNVVNVVVMAQSVQRGNVINADALQLLPIQQNLYYSGMFNDISQVVGKMAKYDLEPGTFLTAGMIASTAEELSGTGSDIALSIPRGMVAISLPINRISSVSYPPQAGDHVNVIVTLRMIDLDTEFQTMLPNKIDAIIAPNIITSEAGTNLIYGEYADNPYLGKGETVAGLGWSTYSVPSEGIRTSENKPNQRPRLVSQNLLQNAIVLNVGTYASNLLGGIEQKTTSAETTAEGEAAPVTSAQAPDYISLIVTPQDAISLNYLIYSGAQITLVLRSANDDSRVQTEAATLQFLLDQYDIPVPVKLPYGVDPRADDVYVAPIPTVVVVPTAQP